MQFFPDSLLVLNALRASGGREGSRRRYPTLSRKGEGGGRSGIRTRDTVSRIHTFQACAFNHSATPPQGGSSYSLRAPARNSPFTSVIGPARTGRDDGRGHSRACAQAAIQAISPGGS